MCTTCAPLVQALKLCPCACVHEHPYWPRGKLVKECPRCRALREFEAMKAAELQHVGEPAC